VNVGYWQVRDVTSAAARAAAIKGAADIPPRSPFKMSYTQIRALSCSDPKLFGATVHPSGR